MKSQLRATLRPSSALTRIRLVLATTLTALALATACGGTDDSRPGGPGAPGGGTQGTTEGQQSNDSQPSSDIGKTCQDADGCSTKLCVKSGGVTFGYCTKECESFTDCPDFWECAKVDNGSTTYCLKR